MFQLSDARVFHGGAAEWTRLTEGWGTRELNHSPQTWTEFATAPIKGDSAVMYAPDWIVKAGGLLEGGVDPNTGAGTVVGTTVRIHATDPNPTWETVSPMNFPRVRLQLVVLADGKVLAVGGERDADVQAMDPVLEPELYDPSANTWTNMAPMAAGRWWHSIALLLPDARVLAAGGTNPCKVCTNCPDMCDPACPDNQYCSYCDTCTDQTHATWQVYSPPYLFQGIRPAIKTAPNAFAYGSTFPVALSDVVRLPTDVINVNLIRLGAVTHGFDQDTRFLPLSFTQPPGSNLVTVTAPADGNEAPPGYYMLFVLTTGGIPSGAKIMHTCWAETPLPDPSTDDLGFGTKDRYVSFSPGNPGQQTALRVDLIGGATGTRWFVQAPQVFCENSGEAEPPQGGCGPAPGSDPTFMGATVDCTPYYYDWHGVCDNSVCRWGLKPGDACSVNSDCRGVIHVYDEGGIPNSTYDIQAIHEDCDILDEAAYSAPLTVKTSIWGDVVGAFIGGKWDPPDGSVDIATDVTAVLQKFQNAIEAPIKARADQDPSEPDREVNISDVTYVLNAFSGDPYPFSGPNLFCLPLP